MELFSFFVLFKNSVELLICLCHLLPVYNNFMDSNLGSSLGGNGKRGRFHVLVESHFNY